ncbi:hypothetical protein WH47_04177 [Habropoda laboriosa]|uniref:Protein takeout n=1 Tax=Habropoda laboriosa TaxID=597456 RepID=A0A0L7QV33_9HYME|nr:hypothetical protein WH47_04177 [Habropoda laboriosa]
MSNCLLLLRGCFERRSYAPRRTTCWNARDDPFQRTHMDVNLSAKGLFSVNGTLDNVRANGLSNYKVNKGDFAIVGLKANVSLTWDDISIMTKYNVKGTLIDSIPFFGNGNLSPFMQVAASLNKTAKPAAAAATECRIRKVVCDQSRTRSQSVLQFPNASKAVLPKSSINVSCPRFLLTEKLNRTHSVVIKGLTVTVDLKLGVKDKKVYVTDLVLHAHIKQFPCKITGLFDDEGISNTMSQVITEVTPGLLDDYQNKISAYASPKVADLLNKLLKNYTLKDLMEIISGKQ